MPSLLKSQCPQCGMVMKITESQVGRRVRCPGCKQSIELSSVHQTASTPSLEQAPTATDTVEKKASDTSSMPLLGTGSAGGGNATRLGRFELKELLGQGAFGRVYRAYDPQLDRQVALKVPTFGPEDQQKIQRFIAEAKAAAKLRHPNIVPTFESGQVDGQYYIAAQFVAGQPLAKRIKDGAHDFRQAAEWVRQLAEGLSYAHGAGIVHRDIKPDNVMLDEHGVPQIMDFGLAKRLNDDSAMTTDGSLLGTPAYMAPEQARGELKNVGPHSDQYSLGVVLYELLTGKKPFQGAPHSVIAQVIATEPATPRSVKADIPEDLEAICQIAMNKTIAERYASCAELSADLARWLGGYETHARPLSRTERAWRWCRRNAVVAGLAAAVAALLFMTLMTTSTLVWMFATRDNHVSSAPQSNSTSTHDVPTPAPDAGTKPPEVHPPEPPKTRFNALDFSRRQENVPAYVELFPMAAKGPLTVEVYTTIRSTGRVDTYTSIWTCGVNVALRQPERDRGWFWGAWTTDGSQNAVVQVREFTPGKRVHLAGVFDNGELRFFVDGRLGGKGNVSFELPSGDLRSSFGRREPTRTPFDGTIDEARISQIARYRSEFTPPLTFANDANTLALYHFDGGQGDILFDSSGNGRHGKIFGAQWVVENGVSSQPNQTAGSAAGSSSSDSTADLASIQGTWYATAEEFNGAKTTTYEIRRLEKTLSIQDDRFTMERVLSDGKFGPLFTGTMSLNPSATPKQFDWVGRNATDGKAIQMLGLYEIVGDDLRLVYTMLDGGSSAERPVRFTSTGHGGGTVVITFSRKPLE